METQGRTFLVTGGGSGLGAAVAHNLTSGGASVIAADLEVEESENIRFVETDVTDQDDAASLSRSDERGGARPGRSGH